MRLVAKRRAGRPGALRGRWSTPARPVGEQTGTWRQVMADDQPGFLEAVAADTRVTAGYRGENQTYTTRIDAFVQAVRLAWITDSFFAQVCYRARVACQGRGIPLLPSLLHHLSVMTGQVNIGETVVMAPGIYLPHGQVVVAGLTRVGPGVVLRPFVTVGLVDGIPFGPTIGAGTMVGTGAKVVGPVRVGERCQIGANAVVRTDVPDGAVAVGVPAKVVG